MVCVALCDATGGSIRKELGAERDALGEISPRRMTETCKDWTGLDQMQGAPGPGWDATWSMDIVSALRVVSALASFSGRCGCRARCELLLDLFEARGRFRGTIHPPPAASPLPRGAKREGGPREAPPPFPILDPAS